MRVYSERIYTPNGYRSGIINIENGVIKEITESNDKENAIDYTDKIIVPGFIDVHIHGWATGSFIHQPNKEALKKMSADMIHQGVTSYLATTKTDSLETIKKQVSEAQKYKEEWTPTFGTEMIGVHLEGPFLNKKYKGMQPEEYCLDPNVETMEELLENGKEGLVKLVTLAPELPGAKEVIKYLHKKGIQISIGHSAADFEDIARLKGFGLGGFTHTYSGMKGLHHRELGVLGAAMYFDDMNAEFGKQTGLTVKPEAFAIMYKIKGAEGIHLTTDCTGLGQTNDPKYHYIREATFEPEGEDKVKVTHDDGREEIFNKSDYQSVKDIELGFLGSVKNVVKNIDASIGEIVTMASENPAKYIGVYDKKGSIEAGKDADFLVINGDWDLLDVYIAGEKQPIQTN